MIRVTITVKSGLQTIAQVEGRPRALFEDLADVSRVIEVEQWLERMTGLRFHIDVDVDAAPRPRS